MNKAIESYELNEMEVIEVSGGFGWVAAGVVIAGVSLGVVLIKEANSLGYAVGKELRGQ
ncbi:MAG: hypothetical protein P8179_17905 [Candidatus Thiodiazotropha sp.]|jgi:hypothetical protein